MFQAKEYEYFQKSPQLMKEYVITKGDLLSLEVFSREGFDLVDVLVKQSGNNSTLFIDPHTYLVDQNGFVELPIFGNLLVEGMTENQLEDLIELKSEVLFNEPYAIVRVENRRAILFKGSDGMVVPLNEGPTSILEVIAKSGGLNRDLKAYKIKILRGDLKAPEIIEIDLSTMTGVQNANLIVQTNDVIYVDERVRFARGVVQEIAPILSLLTSVTALIVIINR